MVKVGDEDQLIPPNLQEELLQELCKRKHDASEFPHWINSITHRSMSLISFFCSLVTDTEELNCLVSEAFLHFFVKTVGHFENYIKRPRASDQPGTFHKKNFVKATEPTCKEFVRQFVQTQMFDLFIQEEEKQLNHQGQNLHSR